MGKLANMVNMATRRMERKDIHSSLVDWLAVELGLVAMSVVELELAAMSVEVQ